MYSIQLTMFTLCLGVIIIQINNDSWKQLDYNQSKGNGFFENL